jgi:hypothetical protein
VRGKARGSSGLIGLGYRIFSGVFRRLVCGDTYWIAGGLRRGESGMGAEANLPELRNALL